MADNRPMDGYPMLIQKHEETMNDSWRKFAGVWSGLQYMHRLGVPASNIGVYSKQPYQWRNVDVPSSVWVCEASAVQLGSATGSAMLRKWIIWALMVQISLGRSRFHTY